MIATSVLVRHDYDIAGFDIPVDDVMTVRVSQSVANLDNELDCLGQIEMTLLGQLVEGLSGEKLHDHVGQTVLGEIERMDSDHIGVIQ